MSWPSFVADGAVAVIEAAAGAIGTSAAEAMRERARELAFDPAALAAAMSTAVAEVAADGLLDGLAAKGLQLRAVTRLTVNRDREADNQDAIDRLVRLTCALELAKRMASRTFRDRRAAAQEASRVSGLLDDLAGNADDGVFRSLSAVRAALTAHAQALQAELPRVVTAEPSAVLPSLVVAYRAYGDIAREGEIADRNALPRPGFVPAQPIELVA